MANETKIKSVPNFDYTFNALPLQPQSAVAMIVLAVVGGYGVDGGGGGVDIVNWYKLIVLHTMASPSRQF